MRQKRTWFRVLDASLVVIFIFGVENARDVMMIMVLSPALVIEGV
jgi:hypothetical protein